MLLLVLVIISGFSVHGDGRFQKTEIIKTNIHAKGVHLEIDFRKGYAFLNPLIAFWYEDTSGRFIQTLFLSRSVGTSIFEAGILVEDRWEPAVLRKPATLPYWAHKRGILAEDGLYMPSPQNPVPDAISGATPKSDFILKTRTNEKFPEVIRVYLEINQTFDWNDFYNLNKYPEEENYLDNSQPAIIYMAEINLKNRSTTYRMRPIGHSHLFGEDGGIYRDMDNISTALSMVREVRVRVK